MLINVVIVCLLLFIVCLIGLVFYLYLTLEELKLKHSATLTEVFQDIKDVGKYYDKEIETLNNRLKQEVVAARKDSLDKSRSVMRGQVSEQLAPLLLTSFNLKDFKFIGQPIDYIIFSGASDISDNVSDEINEVVFLEIKTGNASMTKVQRRIRDAIANHKVRFVTYNPDTKTTKDYSENV